MTNTGIKFYKVNSMPAALTEGGIYFNSGDNTVRVATSTTQSTCFSGVIDATYAANILTITKANGSNIVVDLSDVASAQAVATALSGKVDTSRSVSAGEGLEGGGTLTEDRTIKHLIPTGAAEKTSAGFYKIKTDKFGHVTGTTAVSKSDITNLGIPSTDSMNTAISTALGNVAEAMLFKGTLGSGGTITSLPTNGYKAGWVYKVKTIGTYAGIACEVGDMIIAINNGPASGTSVINADWSVVQTNIDGAVTGPTESVDAHVAVFDGTTGKVIKDSGFTIGKSVPSNAVFTDTKVTSAANHYTPSAETYTPETGAAVVAGGSVITGITKDSKGHIVKVTTGAIPAAPTLAGLSGVGTVEFTSDTLEVSATKSGTKVTLVANMYWEEFD